MGALPSFCRRPAADGSDERPLRLAPSTIQVATPVGNMNVKVWIGGHGFPMVVLHGLSANSKIYLLWLGFLARYFKVIAVDLPGHGGTDNLPPDCEFMQGSGILLNCLLEALGVSYTGIMAHSLGGRIACEAVAREPGRYAVLILADPVTGDAWDRRARNVRRMPWRFLPLVKEFLQDFGSLIAQIRRTDGSTDLIRQAWDTYIGHVVHPMRSFVPITAALMRAQPSVPLLEAIARAEVPTVVIWGDQDHLIPRAAAESTAEITHGRLILVKDSGHLWPLQDRGTAVRILLESLSDDQAPDSLGILLSKAVRSRGRINPRFATQIALEGSRLYTPNALVQTLTPPPAFWRNGTLAPDRLVTWSYTSPTPRQLN